MVWVSKSVAMKKVEEGIDYLKKCYDYLDADNACEADYNIRLGILAVREALPIISSMADREEEETCGERTCERI